MSQRFLRNIIVSQYRAALDKARIKLQQAGGNGSQGDNPEEPSWWLNQGYEVCLDENRNEACEALVFSGLLKAPTNQFRGKLKWEGQKIFPQIRAYLTTGGLMLSDHRYMEDLIYDRVSLGPEKKRERNLFSTLYAQLNKQGESYNLGFGSYFADHFMENLFFGSQQLPLIVDFRSEFYPLGSIVALGQVYSQLELKYRKISLFRDLYKIGADRTDYNEFGLGPGSWSQAKLKLLAFHNDSAYVNVETFLNLDLRLVDTSFQSLSHEAIALDEKREDERSQTNLFSPQAGFVVSSPLQSTLALYSDPMNHDADVQKTRFMRHKMQWDLYTIVRPYTRQSGSYGKKFDREYVDESKRDLTPLGSVLLTYFDTDSLLDSESTYVTGESKFVPSTILKLATSHTWKFFDRTLKKPQSADLQEVLRKENLSSQRKIEERKAPEALIN